MMKRAIKIIMIFIAFVLCCSAIAEDSVYKIETAEGIDIKSEAVDEIVQELDEIALGEDGSVTLGSTEENNNFVPDVPDLIDQIDDEYTDSGNKEVLASSLPWSIYNGVLYKDTRKGYLIIPEGVQCIDDDVYKYHYDVFSITIPDGVTYIGDRAFYGIATLERVTMADSVSYLGKEAFYGCYKLTDVTLSNQLDTIEDYTFCGCTRLSSITIPDSVQVIGKEAFKLCSKLQNITLPKRLRIIGTDAFYGCSKIESVIIPPSVDTIESGAFKGISCSVTFESPQDSSTESHISIADDAFSSYNTTIYVDCSNEDVVEWAKKNNFKVIRNHGDSVTIPGKEPTCAETGLTDGEKCSICGEIITEQQTIPVSEVHTPETIPGKEPTCTERGWTEYTKCSVCGKILKRWEYIPARHIPEVLPAVNATLTTNGLTEGSRCAVCGQNLVAQKIVPKLKYIYYTDDTAQYYVTETDVAYINCTAASAEVKVADSINIDGVERPVTAIAYKAFYGNNKLVNVTIGKNVKNIYDEAFKNCKKLKKVTINSKKLKTIGKSAFNGCKKLKTVTIKSTKLKKVGSSAFKGVASSVTFKCPSKQLKAYKKLIKKAGAPSKAKYKK